jgi:Raf kinase inhibitor-like YbhB/YbcL family protein
MHLSDAIYPARHPHIPSGLLWRILLILGLLFAAPFLAGCRHDQPALVVAAAAGAITLSSSSLQDGKVSKECTCDGEDKSPALSWTAPPAGTKAFALIVTDPDAPGGTFTHWVLYNLPANKSDLAAGMQRQGQLADGSRQGQNDFGRMGYGGPCPPSGSRHRYVFTLTALDGELGLPPGATRAQLEDAMKGHVIAQGQLTARYGR